MALIINPSSPLGLTVTAKPSHRLPRSFVSTVRSQSDPPAETEAQSGAQPKKLGFGPQESSEKKRRGKRERASIIRRSPVEKPDFAAATVSAEEEEKARERGRNESAFLLAWLGLGGIILLEGIALAASGFLPEEWDKLFVKYLYPSFTPTVALFVAGTVGYGVSKYLQNEKLKRPEVKFLIRRNFEV